MRCEKHMNADIQLILLLRVMEIYEFRFSNRLRNIIALSINVYEMIRGYGQVPC